MSSTSSPPVTQLLGEWEGGDASALDRLMPLVYEELRRRARQYMSRERIGNSLQATAVVHEVYLRLAEAGAIHCSGRAHFLAISTQMMRRILTDAARARLALKRGGVREKISLEEGAAHWRVGDEALAALDEALDALARKDPRKAKVVELRFFGGLSLQETAEALGVSEDTVGRDWNFAKAWLAREVR